MGCIGSHFVVFLSSSGFGKRLEKFFHVEFPALMTVSEKNSGTCGFCPPLKGNLGGMSRARDMSADVGDVAAMRATSRAGTIPTDDLFWEAVSQKQLDRI